MAEKVPDKIEEIITPISLEYDFTPGRASTIFLRGIKQGRILGQRCPISGAVYVPPRGSSPTHGVATEGEIEVSDHGTLLSFTVVHIPIPGSEINPPFVAAIILLDGADQTCLHIVSGCDTSEVRMGMRVRAVWKPEEEWETSFENIRYFEPSGEPDVSIDELRRASSA